jgi:outer membrane lipoprotein-sorting protein
VTVAVLLALGCTSLPLCAQVDASSNESHLAQCNLDGRPFLDGLVKTTQGLDDYQFDSSLTFSNSDKTNGGLVFFKKEDLVKIIVRSNGLKNGSVVVKQADGTIKASGGPHLRFLKMTLADDSRLLQLPNGYNAIKSDFLSLLLGIKELLSAGGTVKVTSKPLLVNRLHQNVHILEVTTASAPSLLAARIFIDPKANVPVEWDVYRDGSLLSTALFNNFKANLGLKDDFFKL